MSTKLLSPFYLQHLLYKPMVTSQEFINLHQTIFNSTHICSFNAHLLASFKQIYTDSRNSNFKRSPWFSEDLEWTSEACSTCYQTSPLWGHKQWNFCSAEYNWNRSCQVKLPIYKISSTLNSSFYWYFIKAHFRVFPTRTGFVQSNHQRGPQFQQWNCFFHWLHQFKLIH